MVSEIGFLRFGERGFGVVLPYGGTATKVAQESFGGDGRLLVADMEEEPQLEAGIAEEEGGVTATEFVGDGRHVHVVHEKGADGLAGGDTELAQEAVYEGRRDGGAGNVGDDA